ncbi:MAG: hypothetical protein ACPGU5_01350 [Lishizhenia sp.]
MSNTNLILILSIFFLYACGGNETFIPKPPTYLKIDLPERMYTSFEDTCSIKFEIPTYTSISKSEFGNECNKNLNLGPLNGVINLSLIDMDTSLAAYVNYAIDKVEEHKIKASAIKDTTILRPNEKVFGTLFTLEGNVATPFQFYLTDSTSHFMSGVVYFNSIPNYDSIKPVLDFVRKDIIHLLTTTTWN